MSGGDGKDPTDAVDAAKAAVEAARQALAAAEARAALEAARQALAAAEARRAMAEAMARIQESKQPSAPEPAAAGAPNKKSGAHRLPSPDEEEEAPPPPPMAKLKKHTDEQEPAPKSGAHKLPPKSGAHKLPPKSGAHKLPPKSGAHKLPPKSGDHKVPDRVPERAPEQKRPKSATHDASSSSSAGDERAASSAQRRAPASDPHKKPSDRLPSANASGVMRRTADAASLANRADIARTPDDGARKPPAAKPSPAPGPRPSGPASAAAKAPPPKAGGVQQRRMSASDFGKPVGSGSGPVSKPAAKPDGQKPAAATNKGAPAPSKKPAPAPGRPAGRSGAAAAPVPIAASGRKRLQRFLDLGWACAAPKDPKELEPAAKAIAIDVGVEGLCVTSFEGRFDHAKDQAQPTMAMVVDPHAFRTMERKSLEYGLKALQRWPSERVLRGTDGELLVASQIGLVAFPADHVLSAMLLKARDERRKQPKEVVLTLPTFLPSDRDEEIRTTVAPWKKGAFRGVPSAIGAAYFYLAPALDRVNAEGDLAKWSRDALAAGRVLVLDWGASGLEYGVVTVKGSTPNASASASGTGTGGTTTELRLNVSGIWPSLGGHRLTASVLTELKVLLTDRIHAAGPSAALLSRALIAHGEKLDGRVPFPVGYEEAFRRLTRLGPGPLPPHEEEERRRLRNILFPTQWRFAKGEEPQGYAPYRKLAVAHFKALWEEAEKIKRMIFSDPEKYRQRRTIPWDLSTIDSPFCSHLDEGTIPYPVEPFLERVRAGLQSCLAHIDRRLAVRGIKPTVHVGLKGMQSCSPLLADALAAHAGAREARALSGAKVCPSSSDPLEQKAVTNRGVALLNRDKKKVDFGPLPDVLPFSVQIADCLGNIEIFHAGPIDELSVFQRRFRVEGGSPQLEFYIYESEDGSHIGTWGAIDFTKPFEFSERDRVFGVDPRYGFGGEVPKLSDIKKDSGAELAKHFHDRGSGSMDGVINFRAHAPRESEEARRLLHFLEHGLTGEFHRKVYLLEREFAPPPRRFDFIYQRYYLSRSQELIVVREWWAPVEGEKLMRHKTLHTCQGTTTANAILGLEWGRF